MSDNAGGRRVGDAAQLREIVGPVMALADGKEMPRLDRFCRQFIALSPFLCLGTADAEGRQDVSPRGDPPGFVKVLDDTTLAIPDRPGNRRVDSMRNLLASPGVGIIFFVPGVEETLRVNGRARLSEDPALLAGMAVHGKAPRLAIVVTVEEAFFHCAKALKRSRLWQDEARIERSAFPSYGEIVQAQRRPDAPVEEIAQAIEDNYRNELY